MMEISFLYVSRSQLRLPEQEGEVDAIVSWSRSRNTELDVTGALVFTERNFAQYLEGPEAAVDALMDSIRRDPRHADVQTIFRRPVDRRVFATWALAYAGPSTFVSGHVQSVEEGGATTAGLKAADRLISLLRQFVDAQMAEERRKTAG